MTISTFARRTRLVLIGCAALLSAGTVATSAAQAQSAPPRVVVAQEGRLRVESGNFAALMSLEQRRDVKVVELELTQAQLRQVPQAWESLSRWVSRGGVVLLHSDAAQLFGFRTVAARERTRERAGQLFGRARAALPFGAHPLLWGGVSNTAEGRGRGAMGVYLVYYQLQSGDHLALRHGAGVPLLSVTDLTAAMDETNEPPLYAAMMAPYGNGWALVLPRTVEARADGPTFARNLDKFLSELSSSRDGWTSVAASDIEQAHRRILQGKAVQWPDVSLAFREALQPVPPKQWPSSQLPAVGAYQRAVAAVLSDNEANKDEKAGDEDGETPRVAANAPTPERLLMRSSEAAALARFFSRADAGQDERALLEQLAGRLALQRGQAPGSQVPDVAPSADWFSSLVALDGRRRKRLAPTTEWDGQSSPDEAVLQLQLWNGMFAATAAHAFGVDARQRAVAWREALHWWNLALGEPLEPMPIQATFVPDPANAPEPLAPKFAPVSKVSDYWLGSVPTATVKQWQNLARWEFDKALREAPMTLSWQGPHGEQHAINMYPLDAAIPGLPTLIEGNEYPQSNSFRWRLVQRTFQLLDGSVRADLGWGADQVEVRLTPVPWLEHDYDYGIVDWGSLVDHTNITFSDSRMNLWSLPELLRGEISGVSPLEHHKRDGFRHDPTDPYDTVYTRKTIPKRNQERFDEIAKNDARRKMRTDEKSLNSEMETIKRGYFDELEVYFAAGEQQERTLPNYLAHAHASLLIRSLTQGSTSVPHWLQEGLTNYASLSLARAIESQGIYPALHSELQHVHRRSHQSHEEWQRDIVNITSLYEPHESLRNDYIYHHRVTAELPVARRLATHQVHFFYEQFGKGAVVETLQRLGSGQNIDQALQATTGLDQQQFMARWQSWENTPQAAAPNQEVNEQEGTPDALPGETTEADAWPDVRRN